MAALEAGMMENTFVDFRNRIQIINKIKNFLMKQNIVKNPIIPRSFKIIRF